MDKKRLDELMQNAPEDQQETNSLIVGIVYVMVCVAIMCAACLLFKLWS